MLDWKILAASFAALLFVSTLLIGDFGIGDFFTTVSEKLGEWLGNSPFSGMFTTTKPVVTGPDTINVRIQPETFVLRPDQPINISFDNREITGFSGTITVNYTDNRIIFDESNSDLSMTMPLETIKIEGLAFRKLDITEMQMETEAGEWDFSTENGSIEIHDFFGTGEITPKAIEIKGNISKLVRL